jgi:hypothetical protein
MRDGAENVAELELLRAQRAQLARRLQPPWWYVPVCAVGWAAAFAAPIASHYLVDDGAAAGLDLLALVVLLLLQYALARASGVVVVSRTWHYPSGRAGTVAMVVVIIAASQVERLLLQHGQLAAAIVTGVLATVAAVGCWQAHLRGIRRDLATGRGAR